MDADACPVKDEVYRVAKRYGVRVVVVANTSLRVPADPSVELVVRAGFGAADDYIAEQAARPMERVGSYLHEADLDRFGSDVRRFVRERPAAVAVGAVAVGVVAGRLLKASAGDGNGGGELHGP